MIKFTIISEFGRGFQRDGYIDADYNADATFEEEWGGLMEWLNDNIVNNFIIEREYNPIDFSEVEVLVNISFYKSEDAVAFKMRWL